MGLNDKRKFFADYRASLQLMETLKAEQRRWDRVLKEEQNLQILRMAQQAKQQLEKRCRMLSAQQMVLDEALGALDAEEEMLLRERYIRNMSAVAMARRHHMSRSTLFAHLKSALEKLDLPK